MVLSTQWLHASSDFGHAIGHTNLKSFYRARSLMIVFQQVPQIRSSCQFCLNKETLIYDPLNCTIPMKVFRHLQQIGHPSHRLSDVLVPILENFSVKTAHPLQTSPLDVEEERRSFPSGELSTAPFITRMVGLTTRSLHYYLFQFLRSACLI